MNMYWVYDLPNWLFGSLTVVVFVLIGIGGLYLTRDWAQRLHVVDHSHNDIVGFYLAAVTVFYGITLALLAVGTWTTYSEVQGKIDHEATSLGSLYSDISAYPEPLRGMLRDDLRRYTRQVIDVGWPLQRRGIVPNNATSILKDFQEHLMSFEPQTERQKILAVEAYAAYNELTQSRQARLNSVTEEMPGPLWVLVIAGALVCVAVTWCFHTGSFGMHFWMTVLFSALLGLMIYLIAALDNPYRGRISVSPEPLERVYQQLMSSGS
jgi:hypothetical protein